MKPLASFPVMAVLAAAGIFLPAQQQPPAGDQSSVFTTQTTNVIVPALVRDAEGRLVYTLQAGDFVLTDDGVPQKLTLEHESGSEPLALVIVIELGGAGARQFEKDKRIAPPLAPMLPSIVGDVHHRVAVVTFDSQPKLIQEFTSDLDEAEATLRDLSAGCSRQNHYANCTGPNPIHDKPMGDNGAAILDSLEFAVNLLRAEPARLSARHSAGQRVGGPRQRRPPWSRRCEPSPIPTPRFTPSDSRRQSRRPRTMRITSSR